MAMRKRGWLLVLGVVLLLFVSCSGKPVALTPANPVLVMAHSQGIVSRLAPVTVILANGRPGLLDRNSNPFVFDPPLKGQAVWSEDGGRVDFQPESPLEAGRKYRVRFDFAALGEAFNGWFDFNIQAAQPSFALSGLRLSAQKDGLLVLSGVVRAEDLPSTADVESLLQANLAGNRLDVSWSHPGNGLHHFNVRNIARSTAAATLRLAWDGRRLGASGRGRQDFTIPAKGAFEVLSISGPDSTESSALTIAFSEPLNPAQDLRGLIHTGQSSVLQQNLRYEIEGGLVRVYASLAWPEELDVVVEPGVQSASSGVLAVPVQARVNFDWQKPQVRFAPGGVIVPSSQGTTVVLETMNLAAVYVEALQIQSDNMLQFLQVNELSGSRELKRVGEVVWSSTVDLGWTDDNKNRWMPYALDLSPLLAKFPDGMFQLRVVFGREHIRYVSPNNHASLGNWKFPPVQIVDPSDSDASYWDWYEEWFNWDEYYRFREDPTHPAFYIVRYGQDRSARRNVLVSDVGIMAKQDVDGAWHVAASDLRSARPLSGAWVSVYSFARRQLARAQMDASGIAVLKPATGEAAFVVVEPGSGLRGKGYLKLNQALATSHFDVAGEIASSGLKGFIYGDRGVWRPGDEIHLVCILYDRLQALPAGYPVSFELINPLGQVVRSSSHSNAVNGMYYIKTATDASAPTGTWTARIKAGGSVFSKALKIETIMPNRLKMSLDYGAAPYVAHDTARLSLSAAWLHGAPAPGLKADVSMILGPASQAFAAWPEYQFMDPNRPVPASRRILYDGYLDDTSNATFNVNLVTDSLAPGPLSATFLSRVYEQSGLFSSESFSVPYHPFSRYIGLKLPKGDAARNMLLTDTDHKVELILVDRDGKPVSGNNQVTVSVYKLQWRWWWEKGAETLAEQAGDRSRQHVSTDRINIRNGVASWNLNIKYPSWGRYLIMVEDNSGGHTVGQVFYMDWPGWAGKGRAEGGDSSLMLSLTTSQDSYRVGQPVRVSFPSNNMGRAHVSIERAGRVIREEWIQTSADNTVYEFMATADMAPNIYVHVSFIQNHLQTANDLPIRLYGIVPVMVENPQTRLQPLVQAPGSLAPATASTFSVTEANGRAMTYTVAVVDEGLLGITRYSTPNPWNEFYRKEASQLKSFDMYKDVASAFTGRLQTLLAIGGSDFGDDGGERKVSRFPPVVRFFGPFSLAAGERHQHSLELGPYIGAVRFMVVASTPQGAYGRSELEVPIRTELMSFITAPRVLGPGEKLTVPVNVFSFLGPNQNVTVSLQVEGEASLVGEASKQLRYATDGEQSASFELAVAEKVGSVRLIATARSGTKESTQTIDIPVRSAAIPQTAVASLLLAGNSRNSLGINLPGISGSNQTWLELSTLPPVDLSSRLAYLIGYPHGCGEQTTSRAFPQLFLQDAGVLTAEQAQAVQAHVLAAIEKLQGMQTAAGGFVFWPGAYEEGQWLSAYISHFLLMAKRQGYPVSETVLEKAYAYLNTQATTWNSRDNHARSEQAYRLYVLALAGKPNLAAMNRYFEYGPHPAAAVYQVAAAYALAGNSERANSILREAPATVQVYNGMERVYGSLFRDRAVMLDALNALGDTARALPLFWQLAEDLSSGRGYSTQELSYALIACLPYMKAAATSPAEISWSFAGRQERLSVSRGVVRLPVSQDSGYANLDFVNHSSQAVHVRLISTGLPLPGQETPRGDGLALTVRYLNSAGIPVNPDAVALGQDVVVELTVRNNQPQALRDIALTFRAPSGWELSNPRLGSGIDNAGPFESPYDYRDLRDDRVMTYFPLAVREQRTFRVYANKTYNGEFFLPAVVAEAMYQPELQAVVPGRQLGRPDARPQPPALLRPNAPAAPSR